MNKLAQENLALSRNPNVRLYLDALAAAEGVKHGYNTAFGNTPLKSLADHPRIKKGFTETTGKKNQTTAAGRYQFLEDTWDGLRTQLKLTDFGPDAQDAAAVQLLKQNGALKAVLAGDYKTAIEKSGATWASLPSSKYAQPKRSWDFMEKQLGKPVQNPYPDTTSIRTAKAPAEDTRPVGVMGQPMSTKQAAALALSEMNQGLPPGTLGQQAPTTPPDFGPGPGLVAAPEMDWRQQLSQMSTPLAPVAMPQGSDGQEAMFSRIQDEATKAQTRTLNKMFSDVGGNNEPEGMTLPSSINRYLDKLLA